MGFLQIIAFLGSAIGQYLIIALVIGMVIPESWLETYGLIAAIGLVIVTLGTIIGFIIMLMK